MPSPTIAPQYRVYPVTDPNYGALGDGSTDDVASIQAAIDAAVNAGGGVIYFPRPASYYKLIAVTAVGSITAHLLVDGDDITFQGAGMGTYLKSAIDATILCVFGAAKPAGLVSWASYEYVDATVYTITAAAQGDTTVTLATAADAANFAAGDYILVRTGETVDTDADNKEPDAELNIVVSADSDTGVITLQWPLSKAYAQEYYVSGTSGRTSTSVTSNLAPFGVANVTDRTIKNFAICDMGLESTAATSALINGGQIHGLRYANNLFISPVAVQSQGNYRDMLAEGNELYITGTGAWVYYFTAATGCVDFVWRDNVCHAQRVGYFHLHEGSANGVVEGNKLFNTASSSDENAISVRSRGYNHTIRDNLIVNAGNANAIFVDEYCVGGFLEGNTVVGSNFSSAYNVRAKGWTIGPNRLLSGNGRVTSSQFSNQATRTARHCESVWVTASNTNPAIFTLPVNAYVTAVRVDVTEAFDSDGTDQITVGYDAAKTFLAAAVDVSSTGNKTVTLGSGAQVFNATARAIEAYYTAGGSDPTVGKGLVVVEWEYVEATP